MDALQAIHVQLDEFLGKASLLPEGLETRFSTFNTFSVFPDPQDCIVVNAIVSERHGQLSSLASQLKQVESAMQKLAAIHAKLKANSEHVHRSLLAHRALTSAARRIPPEVLGEIFYNCLPMTPYITPRDVECPIVLTQVCRHWHAVAISTPRLWSSLSIHLQKAAQDDTRRGYETWLIRAKSVPLTVRVLNDLAMSEGDTTQISPVVAWLRPIILQSNDLWWHGPSIPGLFSTEANLRLERLRITSHRDSPSIFLPEPVQRLRYAYLQCLNHDLQSLNSITLPWAHLSELNMHFALFSTPIFLHLLTLCSSLRNIVVSCLCADEEQLAALRAIPLGSIVHPSIRRIDMKVIRAGLDLLLDALVLPSLEELDICFCYREKDSWPHTQFLAFLTRSRCPLKKLVIRSNKNALPYFAEYKQALPGLSIFTSTPTV